LSVIDVPVAALTSPTTSPLNASTGRSPPLPLVTFVRKTGISATAVGLLHELDALGHRLDGAVVVVLKQVVVAVVELLDVLVDDLEVRGGGREGDLVGVADQRERPPTNTMPLPWIVSPRISGSA
jgi:hypothetical protein